MLMASRLRRLLAALVAAVLLLTACGDSDDGGTDATTTTSGGAAGDESGTAAPGDTTVRGDDEGDASAGATEVVREIQRDLEALGFYDGAIDGDYGPRTEDAVSAFQADQGLTADGQYGPQTAAALVAAHADAPASCEEFAPGESGEGGGTAAPPGTDPVDVEGPPATIESAVVTNTFAVQLCDNPNETTLRMSAITADGFTLDVDAADGTGTISLGGGNESDGISLSGTVDSVQVGDAGDFTVTGVLADPDGDAPYTLTGSCAGI